MTHASTEYRPGLFWILTRIYHHLLRDRPMRNVLPVPESSLDAQTLDCKGPTDAAWDAFMACAQPVKGPSEATPAQEIDEAVTSRACSDRASAQLYLQGRGWERVRRKVRGGNVYFYRYFPVVDGAKVLMPLYVNLQTNSSR